MEGDLAVPLLYLPPGCFEHRVHQNQVRILDFGVAKFAGSEGDDRTVPNLVVGTLAYMSPEQLSGGQELTARTDLYALGVLMYELFTGRKPTGRSPAPSRVDPRLAPELDAIIDRCLQPDPADRFGSAEEIKDHVLAILPGAHLGTAQRERTQREVGAVGGKFTLLDVIRKGEGSSVYLYLDNRDRQLLAIKKVDSTRDGFAEAKALARLEHSNLRSRNGKIGPWCEAQSSMRFRIPFKSWSCG